MSKPDDISQDVWDAGDAAWKRAFIEADTFDQSIEHIARAILAERDRCFKALLHTPEYQGRKNLVFRTDALDAIRKGSA